MKGSPNRPFEAASIHAIVRTLQRETRSWRPPAVTEVAERSRSPFQVLVSTVLSLRTKDETTEQASARLFRLAKSPRSLLSLPSKTLERTIYPVCFYRNKTRALKDIASTLLKRHQGRVPDSIEELLRLKGVGRVGNTVQVSSVELTASAGETAQVFNSNETMTNFEYVNAVKWWAQYFKPDLPANATAWRVTGVEFTIGKSGGPNGILHVRLYLPDGSNMPATLIDSVSP